MPERYVVCAVLIEEGQSRTKSDHSPLFLGELDSFEDLISGWLACTPMGVIKLTQLNSDPDCFVVELNTRVVFFRWERNVVR